jgi:hypothetical protein
MFAPIVVRCSSLQIWSQHLSQSLKKTTKTRNISNGEPQSHGDTEKDQIKERAILLAL